MFLREGLSLGLSVLLFGGSAGAQGRGFGGRAMVGGGHSFGGRGFAGQGFRGMSGFRGRPSFRGPATFRAGGTRGALFAPSRTFQASPRRFGFQPPARFGSTGGQLGFRPRQELGASRSFPNGHSLDHFHQFAGSPFFDHPFSHQHFLHRHFHHHFFFGSTFFDPFFFDFGFFPQHHAFFSPFISSPFGFSSFDPPLSAYGYPCDTRFSSLPDNCVPLYPNGPPGDDAAAYQAGSRNYRKDADDSGDEDAFENPDDPAGAASSAPDPQHAPETSEPESPGRYEPRRVVLTYDGRPQSSAMGGGPLVVTSGNHQLIVSAKSE